MSSSDEVPTQSPVFHPLSRWEEPLRDPHLTLFDLHRQPRKIAAEALGKRILMPLQVLNAEIVCPVCLGYLRKTMMVGECLHRFCDECIQKCLRLGKKECPSCRIHIPSRRSLRPDPRFDAIIESIIGQSRQRIEEEDELEAQRARIKFMRQMSGEQQQQNQQEKLASSSSQPDPTVDEDLVEIVDMDEDWSEPPLDMETTQLVELELRRHPREERVERLRKEWLRLPREAEVKRLRGFLASKLSYPTPDHFEILARVDGKQMVLHDTMLLWNVRRDLVDPREQPMMILHYRLSVPS